MLRTRILLGTALAMVWLPMSASADEAFEEAVRKCAAISDESARLICFDAVSTAKPDAADEPQVAPEPPTAVMESATTAPAPQAPAGLELAEQSAEIEVATGAAAAASVANEVAEEAAVEAAEDAQPLTDDVGMERVDPSAAKNPEYVARVVRCDKHQQSGQTYFFLDNEQVWKQANYRRMSLGNCDFEVRIKKDTFGYELFIPSKDRTVRVSRIR